MACAGGGGFAAAAPDMTGGGFGGSIGSCGGGGVAGSGRVTVVSVSVSAIGGRAARILSWRLRAAVGRRVRSRSSSKFPLAVGSSCDVCYSCVRGGQLEDGCS